MYLIAIAWMYVVLMMALAEAMSAQGTVLGAVFTFLLYGCLPLSIVMYLLGTPMRRRARRAAEAALAAESAGPVAPAASSEAAESVASEASAAPATPAAAPEAGSTPQPDGSGLPAREPIAAERKEG